MARFATTIDLSQLLPPDVIDALSYEAILAELTADFLARYPEYDVQLLEVDPAIKILEVAAYRELILRALINDKARAILLASAQGTDLDQLGVYYGVVRMEITAATDNAPAVMESDAAFRRRIQLAPEAFSVAGPPGAYEFHALAADASIKDAAVYAYGDGDLSPGTVRVYLLTRTGSGAASGPLIDKVLSYLRDGEDKVPATDQLSVLSATIDSYSVTVTLQIPQGPDPLLIKARAEAALATYVAARHRVGGSVPRSGLQKAAMVDGVDNVILASPASDIPALLGVAPYNTAINVITQVI